MSSTLSEKIYGLLLRLYPAHFREAFGDEARQLFRDRSRDEKGFFRGLRLWMDLFADFAISVTREYRNIRPMAIGGSAQQRLDGAPSFHVLEGESLGLEALLFGSLLSLVSLGATAFLTGHAGNYWPQRAAAREARRPANARWIALRRPAGQAKSDAEEETIASAQLATTATRPRSGLAQALNQQASSQAATDAKMSATAGDGKLDAAERQRVTEQAIANVRQYYFDREVGRKTADALLAHEKNGDYNTVTDGGALAELLTKQMGDASHDRHLTMEYSQEKIPEQRTGPTAEDIARYRKALEQNNCFFEKVEILAHNIGYLKLNSFPDISICQPTAVAAMGSLNQVDAIIFDLRDNTGGFPAMVSLIAAYLFDRPEYMYSPREAPTEESWTRSPVPGNRLADKPVYVLTSARTWSGAEQFSYDLKMLKRATLVGERTRGGAHAGVFHRIDDHFGMGIPEAKAVNPFAKTDWEGTGVEPDVKVKAEDALKTAEELAESKLQRR